MKTDKGREQLEEGTNLSPMGTGTNLYSTTNSPRRLRGNSCILFSVEGVNPVGLP